MINQNQASCSTTTLDILWDGVGIHLTFSGLVSAKFADTSTTTLCHCWVSSLLVWLLKNVMGLQQVPNERNRADEERYFPDWFVLPSCVPQKKWRAYTHSQTSAATDRETLLGMQRRLCGNGFNSLSPWELLSQGNWDRRSYFTGPESTCKFIFKPFLNLIQVQI